MACHTVCEGILPLVIAVYRVIPLIVLIVRSFWIHKSDSNLVISALAVGIDQSILLLFTCAGTTVLG